ncbi:hypothetical protein [Paraburkholderia caballeronis]|uniref:hypothetical protein n=1 Tax=Paraburkholderia caballeronis TaxID=416943 RepID=UPI0010660433|nr:hypothetical protein [Paraburkholderia caballeronis]
MLIQLYVDDVREIEQTLDFPDTLRFSVTCHLAEGSFVRLVVGRAGIIDNNHCLFYARITRLGTDHGFDLMSRTIRKGRHGSWRVLELTLRDSLGYDVPARGLAELSHNLFVGESRPNVTAMQVARSVHAAHFAAHDQNFRLPRSFKIRRDNDGHAAATAGKHPGGPVTGSTDGAKAASAPAPTDASVPGAEAESLTSFTPEPHTLPGGLPVTEVVNSPVASPTHQNQTHNQPLIAGNQHVEDVEETPGGDAGRPTVVTATDLHTTRDGNPLAPPVHTDVPVSGQPNAKSNSDE